MKVPAIGSWFTSAAVILSLRDSTDFCCPDLLSWSISRDGANGDVAAQAAMAGMAGPQLFLQFITRYLHWSGELRCRVTTVTRRWIEGTNAAEIITGEGIFVEGKNEDCTMKPQDWIIGRKDPQGPQKDLINNETVLYFLKLHRQPWVH